MSYAVVLSDAAADDLLALPADVALRVEQELRRLAQDPVGLGRRAHFPYPRGQMYQFDVVSVAGPTYRITILFKFHPDEQRLLIAGIGRQEFDLVAATRALQLKHRHLRRHADA
jgi:hypothetical protein